MSTSTHGFSLIEVALVLALCSFLATLGLYASIKSLGRSSLQGEAATLTALLTKARANAMSNIDALPWGVCVVGSQYILFSGASYAAHDHEEALEKTAAVTGIDCASGGLVFEQLSGSTADTNILVTFNSETAVININHAGRITTN